jgi:opacity protein-like surface antigen
MKKLIIAALVASQLAIPAQAADLVDTRGSEGMRPGGFAGARIRVSLDAEPRERIRAGLTVAPTRHDFGGDGAARLRFGEGLEFGFSERRSAGFSFAGQPVRDLVSPIGPDGNRRNISTVAWVGIGVGVLAVTAFALYGLCGDGEICSTDDD